MKERKKVLWLAQSAVIAALYIALTYAQEMLLPGTTSMAVQFRLSEALTLLCVVTPAAIPGLTVGCAVANIVCMSALPLDVIIGSCATLLAGISMYLLRNVKIKSLPILASLMPAVFNGVIIGLEIEIFFIEGSFHFLSFLTQAALVAAGELGVCCTVGLLFYKVVSRKEFKRYLVLS